jgi:hypothetical protein
MRYIVFVALCLASAAALAAPSKPQEAFAVYLKSGAEPKVKDAVWMTDKNLYVGVIDDGSNRGGLADYICSLAKDKGLAPDLVKVIDIAQVARTGKFRSLGESRCG